MSNEIWQIVLLSVQVSGVAVGVASLIGIPIGALLGAVPFSGRNAVVTCFRAGMAMPPVVVGLLIYMLLSRDGPLGAAQLLFTPAAMIIAQTFLAIPFVVSIVTSSVESIPKGLKEQLVSLGASPAQARWSILREARTGVLLSIAAAMGRSLSEVGAVMIVGGNIAGHTRVLTTSIVLKTRMAEYGDALLLAACLVILALGLNSLLILLPRRMGER